MIIWEWFLNEDVAKLSREIFTSRVRSEIFNSSTKLGFNHLSKSKIFVKCFIK